MKEPSCASNQNKLEFATLQYLVYQQTAGPLGPTCPEKFYRTFMKSKLPNYKPGPVVVCTNRNDLLQNLCTMTLILEEVIMIATFCSLLYTILIIFTDVTAFTCSAHCRYILSKYLNFYYLKARKKIKRLLIKCIKMI